jgi:hypothetical protein
MPTRCPLRAAAGNRRAQRFRFQSRGSARGRGRRDVARAMSHGPAGRAVRDDVPGYLLRARARTHGETGDAAGRETPSSRVRAPHPAPVVLATTTPCRCRMQRTEARGYSRCCSPRPRKRHACGSVELATCCVQVAGFVLCRRAMFVCKRLISLRLENKHTGIQLPARLRHTNQNRKCQEGLLIF